MLLDARGDGKNIRVEYDVVGVEVQHTHQQVVATLADFFATLQIVCLALLVECHHYHGGAVALAQARLRQEFFFARP